MNRDELEQLKLAMNKLAEYHELERDTKPWLETEQGKYNNAVFHNQAASNCYSAAIAIGRLISS